ncbi:MAG: PDZ domain-containing protein [Candidatus Omnitrophota bacterium]
MDNIANSGRFKLVAVFLLPFLLLFSFLVRFSCADIVVFKNGSKIKGLIVDEFNDRIILSTAVGEKTIVKSSMKSAMYDTEEDFLLQKAENYEKSYRYVKAYYVYEKILELNPLCEEASKRLYCLRNYLENSVRREAIEAISKKNNPVRIAKEQGNLEQLAETFGVVLAGNGEYVYVKDVTRAASNQLRVNDRIISVWGKKTSYMDAEAVAALFISFGEVKFEIERIVFPVLSQKDNLFALYKKIIGAELKLCEKGVFINKLIPGGCFDKIGIREGDFLSSINKKNTRYMPMSVLTDTIVANNGVKTEIGIRRDIVFWKKGVQ